MNILGIVGARSGSKSIPHKNIKPLMGKPLMGWIIEAAKKSQYVTRVILSTDSPEYQKVGRAFGAETPFLRPAEFANDTATDMDYLTHAVTWLEKNDGWKADIILRLPPTTPLCKTETIDACIKLLLDDPTATSARAIATAPKHPYKLWKIENDELLPFIPKEVSGHAEPSGMARQFYKPAAYAHIDVIAVRYDTLIREGLLTGARTRYHMIDKKDAIDIDTENDFLLAEIILKKKQGV